MNADLRMQKQIESFVIPYGVYTETTTIAPNCQCKNSRLMGPYFGLQEFFYKTKDAFYCDRFIIDSDGVPPSDKERDEIRGTTMDDNA